MANPLTFEERLLIAKYLKMGCAINWIRKTLKRNMATIKIEIERGGGRANYNADYSQEKMNEKFKKRAEKAGKDSHNQRSTLSGRIDNLQMQIDIILDILKTKDIK